MPDINEPFCGLCFSLPFAFAGAGASMYSANAKGKYKKRKKILFWVGVGSVLISLLIAGYFLLKKEPCKECE